MVQVRMDKVLIAPCGMNCAICSGYLRDRKPCGGCGGSEGEKAGACRNCKVTACEKRSATESGFCYECPDYPCARIKNLDKRYRLKYHMSMIENLAMIRDQGMAAFLKKEEERWACPDCGRIISCHTGFCTACADEKRKVNRRKASDETPEELLIAPCGMNCGICSAYLVKKYDLKTQGLNIMSCGGCMTRGKGCSPAKTGCELLMSLDVRFCHECEKFPDCAGLKRIDDGYRDIYHMSMIENLTCIRDEGISAFLAKEQEKWTCPECGGTISCHNGICYGCGVEELKRRKNRYRWEE